MASHTFLAGAAYLTAVVLILNCLVVSSWELKAVEGKPRETCPFLDFNLSCNSGNCQSGGNVFHWKVPLGKGELGLGDSKSEWRNAKQGTVGKTFDTKYKVNATNDIFLIDVANASECCKACKFWHKCKYYQFVNVDCTCNITGMCFLYGPFSAPICVDKSRGMVLSSVGAKCQTPECSNDPHLTGAHGTKYDFNGVPNESYSLISDQQLQVNMKMTGYYDHQATMRAGNANGKEVVRTWIRELGIVWLVNDDEHWLQVVARSGAKTNRGEGFIEKIEFEGRELPRLKENEVLTLPGGLTITLQAYQKSGPYDVDIYTVHIENLLKMQMILRVANPLLQTPEEAYVHISLAFKSVIYTPMIHGILGQTFRDDREERATIFSRITANQLHPITADGEDGKGFLDGNPENYVIDNVLATNSYYTSYSRIKNFALPTSR